MGFLSNILMHPEMLALGVLAISVPIIIHLLNRRRFKEVDWAAMEFLLDAEQKNKKRVRLEHLILLLLRCLTMLLIGMLIARPFLPSNLSTALFDTQQYERILLLDDSLSTQARSGNRKSFDLAKEQLVEMIQSLSANDTDDSVTLLLMSRPEDPIISARPVNSETLQAWIDEINELTPTDLSIDLPESLREIERYVEVPRQDVNRVVYVLSDLLENEWGLDQDNADSKSVAPHEQLNEIAEKVAGVFLVDMGVEQSENLSIDSVSPPEVFIAGVANRIDITVRNHGNREVQQVGLQITVGDTLPIEETIDSIPAGSSVEIGIPITLGSVPSVDANLWQEERTVPADVFTSIPIQASLVNLAPEVDILSEDSIASHAARVAQGIPVLLVDGDPSSDRERSETIFLERAIQPPGEIASGNLVDIVDFVEFDQIPLSRYRVIGLCNVDQVSP
ncbi:MAG: BatA domain-containing protein, partial [Planctomycetota bacterium]|nr:BatA domain-containing protein [Planctomycetota bacterium]